MFQAEATGPSGDNPVGSAKSHDAVAAGTTKASLQKQTSTQKHKHSIKRATGRTLQPQGNPAAPLQVGDLHEAPRPALAAQGALHDWKCSLGRQATAPQVPASSTCEIQEKFQSASPYPSYRNQNHAPSSPNNPLFTPKLAHGRLREGDAGKMLGTPSVFPEDAPGAQLRAGCICAAASGPSGPAPKTAGQAGHGEGEAQKTQQILDMVG